jgi:lysophospholipid hydrolase
LFSILSILTEDMQLPDMLVPLDTTNPFSRNEGERIPSIVKKTNALPNEFNDSHFEENETDMDLQHASSTSNNMNPDNAADSQSSQKSLSEMHENVGEYGENDPTKSETSRNQKKRNKIQSRFKSVHPNLVAKASRTTKLAVIPSSSFKSLCEKYPKAGSHMVQVILTRFQRVTFLTMHKYLGLSSELLAIEKKLNENADGGLSMARFNQKSIEDLAWKLSHQHIDEQSRSSDSYSPKETRGKRPFVEIGESDAGVDLGFSDIERKQRQYFNEINQPRIFISDEDEDIKDAVFESIAQLIGLTAKNACLSAQSSSRGNDAFKTKGRSIEPLIERFYYGRSPNFAGSQSASTISRTFDIDEISMNSIISAAEQVDDADVPDVELKYFTQGEILLKEGDRSTGLYFVLDGVIEASTSAGKEYLGDQWVWTRSQSNHSPRRRKREAFLIHPGSLAGYLSALTGNPSFVTLKAKTDILVGMMPKIILDRYVEKYPNVLLYLAKRLVDQLSPLVFHIDVALEWGQINAGQSLCRQGDKSQSIFIVLTGRLRSIKDNEDNESNSFEILGEYGPSESVGEFEVLLDAPRSSTIHAIRDSEVAIMPKSLFNALAVQHPEIMMTISRMIALRSKQAQETRKVGTNNENMKTVAFLPVSKEVPIVEFAELLKGAMDRMNVGTRILDTRIITKQLGKYAFTKLGRLRLISWLAEQEENHRLVMYVADGGVNSPWTHRCIRQVRIRL